MARCQRNKMQEATYHELARLEHATKARVYARHGMYGKAESHGLRAAHHASFGVRTRAHAESARDLRALAREERRERQNISNERKTVKSNDVHRGADGQPPGVRDEQEAELIEQQSLLRISPASMPSARMSGGSRRTSAPRNDASYKDDALEGADAETRSLRSAPHPNTSQMPVQAALSAVDERVTCAITKTHNGSRKCRKRTKGDAAPESHQCFYDEHKGCVLNKDRIFCVLGQKKNTCRRARGGDIVSDADKEYCKLNEHNLCYHTSEESESPSNEQPTRRPAMRNGAVEGTGSASRRSRRTRVRAKRAPEETVCIATEYQPVIGGKNYRSTCRKATKDEFDSVEPAIIARKGLCEVSQSTGRCALREYARQREARRLRQDHNPYRGSFEIDDERHEEAQRERETIAFYQAHEAEREAEEERKDEEARKAELEVRSYEAEGAEREDEGERKAAEREALLYRNKNRSSASPPIVLDDDDDEWALSGLELYEDGLRKARSEAPRVAPVSVRAARTHANIVSGNFVRSQRPKADTRNADRSVKHAVEVLRKQAGNFFKLEHDGALTRAEFQSKIYGKKELLLAINPDRGTTDAEKESRTEATKAYNTLKEFFLTQ